MHKKILMLLFAITSFNASFGMKEKQTKNNSNNPAPLTSNQEYGKYCLDQIIPCDKETQKRHLEFGRLILKDPTAEELANRRFFEDPKFYAGLMVSSLLVAALIDHLNSQ